MTTFQYGGMACSALALLAIVSSLLVITQAVRNPVNAVLWLITAFVSAACYLITAGMTFLGLSYVIVYVGAIAVLFLFVVMMLNLSGTDTPTPTSSSAGKAAPIAFIIAAVGALVLLPLAGFMTLEAEVHLAVLDGVNAAVFGSAGLVPDFGDSASSDSVWFSAPQIGLVSPMSQVQVLGLTLYTSGALWLLLLSVLLLLAMIVPLALAFTS